MRSAWIICLVVGLICLAAAGAEPAQTAGPTASAPAAPSPAAPVPLSAADIYKHASSSIMVLDVVDKDGKEYTGTAFMAFRDGLAITAWHVVRDAKTVTAEFSDGQQFDVSGLVDKDTKRDIALIKVKVFGRPPLALATTEPEIGAVAYAIGAPEGLEFTISNGIISQIRQISGINVYQFTCATSPGNSGGPIIDSNGQVVGFDDFQLQDGQNLSFAVPSTYVLGLDPTLKTQAWDDVNDESISVFFDDSSSPEGPGQGSGSTTGDDDVYTKLAALIMDAKDLQTMLKYTAQLGPKHGVPDLLIQFRNALEGDAEAVGPEQASDPTLEQIRQNLVELASDYTAGADDFTHGMQIKNAGSMGTEVATAFLARGIHEFWSAPTLTPYDEKFLSDSKAFATAAPELVRHWQDETGPYQIGATVLMHNTLFIAGTDKGGIADKVGLRPGDTIISIDGKNPADFYEFRDALKKDTGSVADIVVMRDEKQTELKNKVPVD